VDLNVQSTPFFSDEDLINVVVQGLKWCARGSEKWISCKFQIKNPNRIMGVFKRNLNNDYLLR
jgi:hypothetical protein